MTMQRSKLFSVRMRSTAGGKHVSGAERLVPAELIGTTVNELIARPMSRGRRVDRTSVTIEDLGTSIVSEVAALDLAALDVVDVRTGREAATRLLLHAGVSRRAAERAVAFLSSGPAPSGNNMRGAMILDAFSGERLEPDRERGVRASRFDWSGSALGRVSRKLAGLGLMHFRTKEALALATKITHAPGIIAELCWSDDPDYAAGYVASRSFGYVRISRLKEAGSDRGGRAIFARPEGFDRDACIRYLEREPLLVTEPEACRAAGDLESLFRIFPEQGRDGGRVRG